MIRACGVATALFLLASVGCMAHPHVFVNNRMTVQFSDGKLQGISFTWTFDQLFSNMILADYDPKRTGEFTPAQAKAVKEGAFDNLENYHYFIALAVGKKPLTRLTIQRFTPSVTTDHRLVYSFFMPVSVPVTAAEQVVFLTVYDDTYYVAFDLLHAEDVVVNADARVSCSLSVGKTTVKPQWPGQYMPDQLAIRFKEPE